MSATPPTDWSRRSQQLAELLSRVALGERQAFAELYQHSSAHLFGVILRICPQRALAEDVLQEVYVNVWRAAQRYEAAQSQPLTWLTSIARNRAIDAVRRLKTEPDTVTGSLAADDDQDDDVYAHHPDAGPGPEELLQQASHAALLQGCMGGLSAQQQQCLALTYYQGLSHAEVASHLGQPLGSVKSWVRRGLQALKDCLERLGMKGDA